MTENPQEDEFSIDFTKAKNFLKKAKEFLTQTTQNQNTTTTQTTAEQEDTFDIKKIKEFATGHKTHIILAVLLLLQFMPNYGFLPWGGIWMRMQSENIPLAEAQAEKIMYENLFKQVYANINQQQPNLPEQEKQAMVRAQINEVFDTDPAIKKEANRIAKFIKAAYSYETNERTYTFMPDLDTYYYLRLADNVIRQGHTGDKLVENRAWDMHTIAPVGTNASIELHPYTLAYLHKIMKTFDSQIPLMQSSAYFPIIATIIIIITLFFIGKDITGNANGVITATLFSLNYIAFTKTRWGMADTDSYNLLFPILFMCTFIKSLDAKNTKKALILILASSAIIATYGFAWAGWWYLFNTAIATIIIYSIYLLKNKNKAELKQTITRAILLIIITVLLASITLSYRELGRVDIANGFEGVANNILGPLTFTKIKDATRTDLWPNVYTTVAELGTISTSTIIKWIGGPFFIIFAIFGLFILFKNKNIKYAIFITIFALAGFYAATKSKRFTLLLVPPISILTGQFITFIYKKIRDINKKRITEALAITTVFIILIALNTDEIRETTLYDENTSPFINQAWWKTLNDIKTNSDTNAIITSWWDYGHHFAYIADRAVTFDGASQNTPMAHWIGKVLTTSNETEATGILKMLACGSNKAYQETFTQTNDTIKSVDIIYALVKISKKEEAKKYLEKQGITDTDKILQYTHCEPPENYFITSEDMRQKVIAWSYLGNWDFKKAYIWQELKNKPEEEAIAHMTNNFNYTQEEAKKAYEKIQTFIEQKEISNGIAPTYTYTELVPCKETQNTINCQNIAINKQTYATTISSASGTQTNANRISYVDQVQEKFTNKILDENGLAGIILIPDATGNYQAILSTPQLTTSIFTRLMYFDGQGLKHFQLFTKRKLIDGGFVIAWKIDWQGNTTNTMQAHQTKPEVTNDSTVIFNILSWIDNGEIIDSTIIDWKKQNITSKADFKNHQTQARTRKIGDKQIIPQLEQAMIGMKAGETKTIALKAEELFANEPELLEKLTGKTINFKIKIEKIR